MTVKELIALLETMPQELMVFAPTAYDNDTEFALARQAYVTKLYEIEDGEIWGDLPDDEDPSEWDSVVRGVVIY